ncbi:substrate-binding and VWA domain-containing protein [Actinoplanes bogorensis]|uniref:Substrate-binding and VWA domain-containing protein n=1 Tax=Paractinoplanes bogorensis TaxID=1610840 RepID=A0ABS5YGQ0_9ACTN|nr:substrate-binding domain-containing protein [Actinoplanes bogorensis]MBU2662558.1 substrate-binding and VWA domain-containing protein [Actinoplanes bogorensis]
MPGRHRHLRSSGLVASVAAVAVLAVAGGGWAGYRQLSADECPALVPLKVAAAGEIAPAITAAADSWTRDGTCVTVTVTAVDPTVMAAAVGRQHGISLVNGGTRQQDTQADIWVPDSSTWLQRLASEAPGFKPAMLGSIAESPLVLALPPTSALSASTGGANARTGKWKALVQRIATDKSLRPATADPERDATGLAGLLVIAGVAGSDAAGAKLKVGAMRALSANRAGNRSALLESFSGEGGVDLAPLSEADLIAYNRERPSASLAAIYPPTSVMLDYPYAVMPGIDPQKAAAAATLRTALSTGIFAGQLARAGIRAPDGSAGAGFVAPAGAPATIPPAATVDPKAITQLLGSWTAITQPGRMLAVFDVSGSMKAKVPTAGGLTRAEVTQGVARQGLGLLDDRWSVGNWTFSTNMKDKQPWIENVPISLCGTHRAELEAAIGRIRPKPDGDTGLYDTALAAYERIKQGWQPGVSNSVVIYTDGQNDNPGGLTIDELVARMTKLRDPKKPVRMIIIGMGTAIDRKELEAITRAAGSGGVFIATDPATIGEIFLEAIASRKGA